MLDIEVHTDGSPLASYHGDGLIVSTPTGSTAYSLSAGGPILHPSLDALVVTPICPHTLSNRPIVVQGSSRIEISLCERDDGVQAQVTNDGQSAIEIRRGDRILVHRRERGILLLHPPGHDYYDILRAKLHWGGHH